MAVAEYSLCRVFVICFGLPDGTLNCQISAGPLFSVTVYITDLPSAVKPGWLS